MSKSRIVNVSPHLLADVSSCGSKGWTRHVKGYTSVSDAIKAKAGQAMHAAIAEYFSNPEGSTAQHAALRVFHGVYDAPFAALTAEQLEPSLTPKNLHNILDRWLETHPPSALPWRKVLMVEEAFVSRTWRFNEQLVQLIVRPDLVVEDNDGFIRFVDTKTTGWHITDSSWRNTLRLSSQVQLYADAVAQRFGARAKLGGWINAIELRQLPTGPRGRKGICKAHQSPFSECGGRHLCTEHQRPVDECGSEHAKTEFIECLTTQARVDRAVRDAQEAAAEYVALLSEENVDNVNMRGTENGTCRWCPASQWCLADRPVAALYYGFMRFDPWPIEVGHRD